MREIKKKNKIIIPGKNDEKFILKNWRKKLSENSENFREKK